MAGRDHVIGGDRATWRAAVINKFLPERVKAHRQARMAGPDQADRGTLDACRPDPDLTSARATRAI